MQNYVSIFALTLALTACSGSSETTFFSDSAAGAGQLSLAVTVPSAGLDVASFLVTLHSAGASCDSPALESLELIPNIEGQLGPRLPSGSSDERVFGNQLLALAAGNYLACAQPLRQDGQPSAQCALAQSELEVVASETAEVLLLSQCEALAVGAASVLSATNSPPTIVSVTASPSLFGTTCEALELTPVVVDPDGDATTVSWAVVSQPEGASFELEQEGLNASFLATTSGNYSLELTVTDSLGASSSLAVPLSIGSDIAHCGEEVSPVFSAIAAGGDQTCALVSNGSIQCWGDNQFGQLGSGVLSHSGLPVEVFGIDTATSITVGGQHACAVLAGGSVRCWGDNQFGQLGDGTNVTTSSPVAVAGIDNAIAVSAHHFHTCALLETGTVDCWGGYPATNYGASLLGNESVFSSNVPVSVTGLDNVTSISTGLDHNCAVQETGAIQCWGNNWSGMLGNGTFVDNVTAGPVSGIDSAIGVSAGYEHTCAVLANGTVHCWGYDSGAEDNELVSLPTEVAGIQTAASIVTSANFSCAGLASGEASCWGGGTADWLGFNSENAMPSPIPGIRTATEIAAGYSHACALLLNDRIQCWGVADFGQLGDGTSLTDPRLADFEGSHEPVIIQSYPVTVLGPL